MKAPKSELTRERIMHAAESVFSRYGYEGARLDDIARKAKIEQPHLYYYFNGKQALYEAVLDTFTHEVAVALDAFLLLPPAPTAERMDTLLDLIFEFIDRHRALLGVGLSEFVHPPRGAKAAAVFVRLAEKLETLLLVALRSITKDSESASHLLLSLEGVVILPFLLDDGRMEAIVGSGKYVALDVRKKHVKNHARALLDLYAKK